MRIIYLIAVLVYWVNI